MYKKVKSIAKKDLYGILPEHVFSDIIFDKKGEEYFAAPVFHSSNLARNKTIGMLWKYRPLSLSSSKIPPESKRKMLKTISISMVGFQVFHQVVQASFPFVSLFVIELRFICVCTCLCIWTQYPSHYNGGFSCLKRPPFKLCKPHFR